MKLMAIVLFLLLMGGVFWQKYHNSSVAPKKALNRFANAISGLSPIVYVGLPRDAAHDTTPCKKLSIVGEGRLGYFYHEPANVPSDVLGKIQEFAVKLELSDEIPGEKLCGGFHADIVVEWPVPREDSYFLFLCFGCSEFKMQRGRQLYCWNDLKNESEAKKLFRPYMKQTERKEDQFRRVELPK